MTIELVKDNTVKDIPEQPIVTYEIVGDMGEDGTKTLYEIGDLKEAEKVVEAIRNNTFSDIPNLDLDEDELSELKGISLNVVLTGMNLDIISYGHGEQSAMAELKVYKVIGE